MADGTAVVDALVTGHAADWDRAGELPLNVLRELGSAGVLCAQIGPDYGGLGLTSVENGELTAYTGALCGSVRSVQTSQGIAAWAVQRLGDREQRAEYLPRLAGGALAAVAFSEPGVGSDLAAMTTRIDDDPHDPSAVVVNGHKAWTTAARYADIVLVFGRYRDGAAAVAVPAEAPGLTLGPAPDPSGCRAAGHADLELDRVRVPVSAVLGSAGQSLSLVVATVLAYGRLSVAWGCVGILRACLTAAAEHARTHHQFGRPLADHQLVSRHLAELFAAEQVSTRMCEYASRCWDDRSPDAATATVLAKHVSAGHAAAGSAAAMQVLASAAAHYSHPVARAHRDAKLMEIIEGSTEISQLMLARHAVAST